MNEPYEDIVDAFTVHMGEASALFYQARIDAYNAAVDKCREVVMMAIPHDTKDHLLAALPDALEQLRKS